MVIKFENRRHFYKLISTEPLEIATGFQVDDISICSEDITTLNGGYSENGLLSLAAVSACLSKSSMLVTSKALDYQNESSISSHFKHIQYIDIPAKKSYSDTEFSSPVPRSTNSITPAFWNVTWDKSTRRFR
jgi:hypothetical protein